MCFTVITLLLIKVLKMNGFYQLTTLFILNIPFKMHPYNSSLTERVFTVNCNMNTTKLEMRGKA